MVCLAMLNIGLTKIMLKNIISLRILYTGHFWTLYIEPYIREISISILYIIMWEMCGCSLPDPAG